MLNGGGLSGTGLGKAHGSWLGKGEGTLACSANRGRWNLVNCGWEKGEAICMTMSCMESGKETTVGMFGTGLDACFELLGLFGFTKKTGHAWAVWTAAWVCWLGPRQCCFGAKI